jgi:hypothetical protein
VVARGEFIGAGAVMMAKRKFADRLSTNMAPNRLIGGSLRDDFVLPDYLAS